MNSVLFEAEPALDFQMGLKKTEFMWKNIKFLKSYLIGECLNNQIYSGWHSFDTSKMSADKVISEKFDVFSHDFCLFWTHLCFLGWFGLKED